MEQQRIYLQSRWVAFYSGVILAIAYGIFASAHFVMFQRTREWVLLLFCISEALTVVFVMFRSNPGTVSINLFDWIVGIAGTFAPLLLRPAPLGLSSLTKYAIIAGILMQIAGLISLNRSFAIVAAKREIKTKGMYRVVRHPLYASYFVIFTGYVLMNTSVTNIVVCTFTLILLLIRCSTEEEHLALDPSYLEYMQKVNYRIIPFVY